MSPVIYAIYKCNGSNYELAKTKDNVKLVIQAVREGFSVLKKLNLETLIALHSDFISRTTLQPKGRALHRDSS